VAKAQIVVEGPPVLADHLAICERGVWDKDEQPNGVGAEAKGDSVMAEETKEGNKECDRKDEAGRSEGAHPGEALDKLLAGIDSIGKRLDALEARSAEPKQKEKKDEAEPGEALPVAADARKDALYSRDMADAQARAGTAANGRLNGI
jgi:hypothetical protein